MKKFTSALLVVCMLSSSTTVYADENVEIPKVETPQGEVDPGEVISPMKLSQKAPFSGVLLSPKAVATITARFLSISDRIAIAKQEATDVAQEECRNEKSITKIQNDADTEILKARIENNQRIIGSYEKTLSEIKSSQTDPALLIGLGAIGGAAVTVVTIFAVAQTMK